MLSSFYSPYIQKPRWASGPANDQCALKSVSAGNLQLSKYSTMYMCGGIYWVLNSNTLYI